jgi:hypothetical protein
MNEATKKGGARPGAGRPKGVPNKRTSVQAQAAAATGITPLAFLLKVMRDSNKALDMRIDAAKAAAPYMHSRLASVEVSGKDGGPIQFAQITRKIVKA